MGVNNSTVGFAFASASTSSNVPALIILRPEKPGPSRHIVEPQSPQKWLVIVLPLLAVLEIGLGFPESTLKSSSLMIMLVL